MKRHVPPLILLPLLLAAFAAGRWTLAEDEEPETVKALHYRLVFAESALDLSHGGGRWVHGLYLPESKVAAMLVFETDWTEGATSRLLTRARLHAYPAGKPQNDLTGLDGKPSAIEEIEIPADLAKQIVDLAKLTARQRAETTRLGAEIEKRLSWKPIPSEGWPEK